MSTAMQFLRTPNTSLSRGTGCNCAPRGHRCVLVGREAFLCASHKCNFVLLQGVQLQIKVKPRAQSHNLPKLLSELCVESQQVEAVNWGCCEKGDFEGAQKCHPRFAATGCQKKASVRTGKNNFHDREVFASA